MKRGEERAGKFRVFRDAVRKAKVDGEAHAVAIVRKAMADDWRAAMTYLERRYPDRWRRRETHEHAGRGGGPVRLEAEFADPELQKALRGAVRLAGHARVSLRSK